MIQSDLITREILQTVVEGGFKKDETKDRKDTEDRESSQNVIVSVQGKT